MMPLATPVPVVTQHAPDPWAVMLITVVLQRLRESIPKQAHDERRPGIPLIPVAVLAMENVRMPGGRKPAEHTS